MDVSVDAAPWCDWAPVSAYLQQLGLSVVSSGRGSGESKQQETGLVLLLHASLAATLQQAVTEGVSPEAAVEEWQRAVEKMMHFCRQNRSQAIMVSLDDLLAAPDAFIDCCQARGFEVKPSSTEFQLVPVAIAPVFELLAQSLLLSRKPLRKVVQQLEALSQPLRDLPEARQPDLGAVLQAYLDGCQAMVRARELNEEKLVLEKELSVAQDNLGVVKKQLDAAQAAAETARREGKQQQDKLSAEIDAQRQAYQAVNDESTLLLEQLHQVQETLEKALLEKQEAVTAGQATERKNEEKVKAAHAETKKLHKQLEHTQKQAETSSQELDQQRKAEQAKDKKIKVLREEVHNLTQQIEKNREVENNLTNELSSVRSQVSSAREEVTELQQENSLILEQLHLVQESYEQLLLQQQEATPGADLHSRVETLRQSGWFDEDWYLQQYPDVRESGADPVEHYLRYGARVGRNPGPDFDTQGYLERYPDVAEAGLNPLYHFVLYGQYENRLASC